MRALVISGGGSKGAFAGGVAQYLIQERGLKYDLYLGTSTGSLLIPHLALGKIQKIREVYTSVNQESIFSHRPFTIHRKYGASTIGINHWNVVRNFMRGSKTFGESHNLLQLIRNTITPEEFEALQSGPYDLAVTVSNLSLNQVEYKSVKDFDYEEFCEWVWISCNYTPFMSLVRKNGCEYADGGLGNMVPIEEAIRRGAREVDAIILHTEVTQVNRLPSRNAFSLLTNMFGFMLDRIEQQNIKIGKFVANQQDAIINFYYTPTVLTTNSLIFDRDQMAKWWRSGLLYAESKSENTSPLEPE
ncbi:patatin-like phospholipase family protein [Robiginitalea sp. M366]|uniref:patatin-like phospholipase family protein n=1 Tax=Robiginitalea aestuariiviva TaxID=3036903 RepID=UPI00240D63C5|nr:patatin-like phospholipase family protein [Robiginitalea aestuariiviva]MDG1572846.1 patatin-like phospholipase family protein [Robiginitalea aestuariiviva]